MAQQDYTIPNQARALFRANLNNVLDAVQSSNSGATAPTDTAPFMVWADTSTSPPTLRIRNAGDTAWLVIGAMVEALRTITGTANQITVTNGDGVSGNPTVAAVIATKAEAEAGADNVKLMTALRTKQAIDEQSPAVAIAEGAPGAVRLYGKAAVPRSQQAELAVLSLESGDNTVSDLHFTGGFFNKTATNTTFQDAGSIVSVLMSGTVNFRAAQTAFESTTCEIRILKNGTAVQTWSMTAGATTVSEFRSVDISISVGDEFQWQVRRVSGSNNANISNQTIRADDAYTRIGIPIKVSDL